MDIIHLSQELIDINGLIEQVSSPKCGAVSTFIGTTRDNFENKEVVRLEYEAYEPMAIAEIKKICGQLREKWQIENIGVIHRLGLVPVKEASIVVAISSEHRKESLEAVHFAIDALKAAVPIWKKEVYADDKNLTAKTNGDENSAWKANQECFWKNDKDPPKIVPSGMSET